MRYRVYNPSNPFVTFVAFCSIFFVSICEDRTRVQSSLSVLNLFTIARVGSRSADPSAPFVIFVTFCSNSRFLL